MLSYSFYKSLPAEAKYIRECVFVKEQGFENEFDDIDNTALHIVAYSDGKAAATGRMFPSETANFYTIGRIAVLPEYRKLHLGSEILSQLENKAKQLGAYGIELSAQCRVQPFYEKNGYKAEGDVYLDEFCEHIHMSKKL